LFIVIGSPLSAILSELYMKNYESINILNHKVYKQYIKAYFRYVDDTFILFKGTNRQAELMVNNLNKVNKNIQFTLETQIDNKINFLDLTIHISNNKFNFNIYRKPTQTDTIIPNDSNHPFSQKFAYFNSILYRLERVPLNKSNYNNEFNIICDIGIKNNFDINTIKKIHKKIKGKLRNQINILPNNAINYCPMKYHNFLSGKFANILNKNNNNVKIAFKTKNNSIQTINNKIKTFTNKNSINYDNYGVYKLICSCNKFYIGKTFRNFKIRYKEHISEIKLKKSSPKSNFAKHVLECNHSIHFDIGKDMNILHDQKNKYINSVLEELLIYNEVKRNGFNNILNIQADFKNNDIYQYILDNDT